jgi:magnesium transporter
MAPRGPELSAQRQRAIGTIRRARPSAAARSATPRPHSIGSKAGLAPGTPLFIGERKLSDARIDIIDYDPDRVHEVHDAEIGACRELSHAPRVAWINVSGVHDIELIEALGECFGLHPMTLEDIVNTSQRPKCEEFPGYFFIAMKMLDFIDATDGIASEHVSLILGPDYVVSFLEDEGDVFGEIRNRIRKGSGRIRSMKADYLAFCLMDAIVDHYFLAVEHIGDRVDVFDDRMLAEPRSEDIQQIHRFKRELLRLRKAVWPLREVVGMIDKSDSQLLRPETNVFWRDLYDHTVQVIDMVETSRDILASLHDTYLSSLSNRMNEVMKILTIISTIFIPLTFIVGVYGMNFEYMPELKSRWGYFAVWAVMLAIGISLFAYFRRRKWL